LSLVVAPLVLGNCSSDSTCNTPGGPRPCSQVTQASGIAGATGSSGAGGSTGTAGASGNPGTAGQGAAGASGSTGSGGAAAGGSGTGGAAAGATGTGGASGAAGGATGTGGATAGASGSAGAGTGGAMGMANAVPSDGCGKDPPAGQTPMTYVKYMEMVTGVPTNAQPRNYYVWLPNNYNPKRAYPTVFVGPGCGSDGAHGIQIQVASGDNAIVVGLDPSTAVDPEHRQCFDSQTLPANPEIPYVEQTVAKVEAAFCVDKSRLFIEGFSSGSWLSYMMGCVDGGTGGLFKAQGNASGEDLGWNGQKMTDGFTCKGPTPWMAGHNNPDGNNAYPGGRDHEIVMNGCTMPPTTMPYDAGPMVKPNKTGVTVSCVQYMGCKAPTIFCTTTGLGHDPQEVTGISTYGFWNFWMSLP
jgi:poly(3-hydroxybutyrate) depolymerase